MENLVAGKPGCIINHAGTHDITNGINSLNSVKKIIRSIKRSSLNTKFTQESSLKYITQER